MKGMPAKLRKQLKGVDKRLPDALHLAVNATPVHKYGAKRTICLYGHNHDSKKEAMWCLKLHELQKEKKILHLTIERTFYLEVNNQLICKHLPDFFYVKPDHVNQEVRLEVVDVKGLQTPEWKLKHKLFKALYPDINYVVV